jgi:hypothetical protein
MFFVCCVFMVGLPVLGVLEAKKMQQAEPPAVSPLPPPPSDANSPLDVLKDRFIRGEIDLEEYEAMFAQLLRDGRTRPDAEPTTPASLER